MSAAEYGFPEPEDAPATYLEVSKNCFNNIVSRWDTTSCGGGLKWQIYPENAYGYNYKNSISNGATFALGARLARFTGNKTYADWAEKIYDWEKKVGLIGDNFEVFDGTDDKTDCKQVGDKTQWTYNNAMMIHGSAFMADYTKDSKWTERTEGFLKQAAIFFNNPKKVDGVMFEVCENTVGGKNCNLDQQSFKAYLGRWMAKTALLAPSTKSKINEYLSKSAEAAAGTCTGEDNACGSRWYVGEFDGETGIGQQLSAMEVTQAVLMIQQGTLPGTGEESQPKPKPSESSSAAPESSQAPKSSDTPKSTAAPKTSETATPDEVPNSSGVPTDSAAPKPTISNEGYGASSSSAPKPSNATSSTGATTEVPQASYSAGQYLPVPGPTGQPGGQFGEIKNSTSKACTCKPTRTTTVYVNPPTSEPAPPAPPPSEPATPPPSEPAAPPPTATATPPLPPPPANTSAAQFTGAASNMNTAGSTIFSVAALAVMAAML